MSSSHIHKHNHEESQRDLQIFEHTLQQLLIQKQSLHLEQEEVSNALKELNKASEPVYRVLGSVMIMADKDELKKELEEKNRLISLRIGAIEKQELLIEGKLVDIRKSISNSSSDDIRKR